jgi:hypothetical protein
LCAKTVKTKQTGYALFYSLYVRPSAVICLAGIKLKMVGVSYMKMIRGRPRYAGVGEFAFLTMIWPLCTPACVIDGPVVQVWNV